MSTADLRTVLPELKAGHEYAIDLRMSNADFIAKGTPFTCRGGIRLGGVRKVDAAVAIQRAVELVKKSDGEHYSFCVMFRLLIGVSVGF